MAAEVEEFESDGEGSEIKEDQVDLKKPLVYNSGGAAVEDVGDSEGVTVVYNSSDGGWEELEDLDQGLDEMDLSEDVFYLSIWAIYRTW